MNSAYKNLQSYPYHDDHTHYRPYYLGNETTPPQMFMNPARPAPVYGCCPWGSNYGYPSPVACHGCCNHSYWPAYYAWGSPYSNVPPNHFPGSCHPYPIQYVTPPGYSVGPLHEYEKNVPGVPHCCGCLNHPPHQKEQRGVRIEEEEPDGERGRRKNDESKFPFQLSNQPNPIAWLQPDQWQKNVDAEQPIFLNGCYPLDLSKLLSSKHSGDGEMNDPLDDDAKRRYPFPVVWMPYKPDQKEKEHKVNREIAPPRLELEGARDYQNFTMKGEKSGGQTTAQARGIPVIKAVQHEDKESSKSMDQELNASGGGHISSQVKEIPVKEMRQHEDKGNPVKNSADNGEEKKLDNEVKKSAKESAARKSPSPPKSSKLPPVCLRVDPLPKRKTANGSSQSPSPPDEKQKPDKVSNDASKVLNSSVNKKLNDINHKESKQGMGITKNVEVVDGNTHKGESDNINKETPISISVNSQEAPKAQIEKNPVEDNGTSCRSTKPDDVMLSYPSENAAFAKVENPELIGSEELRTGESKRNLSEEEAAMIIQSVYRGFDIRRWEPVKKLKQIAKVREQIAEVKHLVQSLESSSSDSKTKSKERSIIGETIMSLLLKLDTIQGLHPSIRAIRKSVVRELVNLQDKLDSMKDEKSETAPLQESVARHEGDAHQNQLDVKSKPENLDTTELNMVGAEANAGGESCMNKEPGLAPTTEVDKREVQNETWSKEDHGDKVLEQSYVTSEVHPDVDEANEKIANESASEAPIGDKEGSKVPVDDETFMSKDRSHENLAEGQNSELSLLQVNSGEVTLEKGTELAENAQDVYANQFHGELSFETSVPNPTEEASEKIAAETCMNEESAAELSGDMRNGEHVNDETSMLKKDDREDLVLQKSSEVPLLQTDSSCATDSAPSETDAGIGCEIAELTQLGHNDLIAQGSPNHREFESSRLNVGTADRETQEHVENCEALDLPVNGVDAGSETKEINPTSSFDSCKFEGTAEDETKTRGVVPENTIPEVFEHTKASESAETCSRKDLSDNISHGEPEEIDASNSISEESLDSSTGNEMDNESIVELKKVDDKEPGDDSEKIVEVMNEAENQELDKIHAKHEANATWDGVVTSSNGTKGMVAEDEQMERNRKLMEENKRLREMMEKLMKSGMQQVNAITTLSRRVKDLEKRLSRKKKVKVKQHLKATTGSVKPSDCC